VKQRKDERKQKRTDRTRRKTERKNRRRMQREAREEEEESSKEEDDKDDEDEGVHPYDWLDSLSEEEAHREPEDPDLGEPRRHQAEEESPRSCWGWLTLRGHWDLDPRRRQGHHRHPLSLAWPRRW
jgi:hypothetical protein